MYGNSGKPGISLETIANPLAGLQPSGAMLLEPPKKPDTLPVSKPAKKPKWKGKWKNKWKKKPKYTTKSPTTKAVPTVTTTTKQALTPPKYQKPVPPYHKPILPAYQKPVLPVYPKPTEAKPMPASEVPGYQYAKPTKKPIAPKPSAMPSKPVYQKPTIKRGVRISKKLFFTMIIFSDFRITIILNVINLYSYQTYI